MDKYQHVRGLIRSPPLHGLSNFFSAESWDAATHSASDTLSRTKQVWYSEHGR